MNPVLVVAICLIVIVVLGATHLDHPDVWRDD